MMRLIILTTMFLSLYGRSYRDNYFIRRMNKYDDRYIDYDDVARRTEIVKLAAHRLKQNRRIHYKSNMSGVEQLTWVVGLLGGSILFYFIIKITWCN